MKQFLFDELTNIYLESIRQNRGTQQNKEKSDVWDRIHLLPIVIECISNENLLQDYRLPYHPSVVNNNNVQERPILVDLFFFHLRRHANDEIIKYELINKIMMSNITQLQVKQRSPAVEALFEQFRNYFLLRFTGLLLCETALTDEDVEGLQRIMQTLIKNHLSIDPEQVRFGHNLELFLATIISKRSWHFLVNLLKSGTIQRINNEWANNIHRLVESKQTVQKNKYLQLGHRVQFTLSTNYNDSSIFPKLHQPYDEMSTIIDKCVQDNLQEQRWKPFVDWIQSKMNENPPDLKLNEMKAMLLLYIYYNYYCTNQLASITTLLETIENTLHPSSEELRVFRAFLQPEQYMIGYSNMNADTDKNYLNSLFELNCTDGDELGIRHSLVNLLVMILLGGKQSFLWTFTFEPLTLQNTYGE